jgi:hypothetical protein
MKSHVFIEIELNYSNSHLLLSILDWHPTTKQERIYIMSYHDLSGSDRCCVCEVEAEEAANVLLD